MKIDSGGLMRIMPKSNQSTGMTIAEPTYQHQQHMTDTSSHRRNFKNAGF